MMPPPILTVVFALSSAAWCMCAAGLVMLAIGVFAAARDKLRRRAGGSDKVTELAHLCFAVPLAIFGAEHLSLSQPMAAAVPSYMPWHLFWIYFVGFALIAASLSIAARQQVRWSSLLFGAMMFLFVAMLHLPGAIKTGGRIPWMIVFRELSFGGAGWVLAGTAMYEGNGGGRRYGSNLVGVGRVLIAITAIIFGAQHFLHPFGLPGVPLEKQMPAWVPARAAIDYLTGAFLMVAGVCFLLQRKVRVAATFVGGWLALLVVAIYGPVLIGALAHSGTGVQIEGLNYFADTLLFSGVILSLATTGRDEQVGMKDRAVG